MRGRLAFGTISLLVIAAAGACSGASNGSGFGNDAGSGSGGSGGGSGSGGSGSGSGSGGFGDDDGGIVLHAGDAATQDPTGDGGTIVTTKTTIYANTDTALYSMDPDTKAVTLIGSFAGLLDASTEDQAVTDVAVDAEGDIYVNSEAYIYKAVLPTGGTGTVQLTGAQKINAAATTRMYALAFAPPGLLGTGETLIGGDGNGEVWSIDPTTGDAKDLGNFGNDPSISGNFLGLSGDIVLYTDAKGVSTGLATIRSCTPPPAKYPTDAPTCTKNSDLLAGINVTELVKAYTSGTPSLSLNGGIYGGSSTTSGAGTGFGELFGLGAWEGDVYAFSRNIAATKDGGAAVPPELISISTTTGAGTLVPSTFNFTSGGWSGAGVTTKVTITVVAPPPPPPPPTPK